jgi:cell division septum initiation protein DivIVA
MKNNKNKLSGMLLSVLILGVIVTLVSVYLYQSFQIDLIMKDLHKMHQQKKELLSKNESLEAEIGRLTNIDVIAKTAMEKFDLHFSREQSLVIKIDDMDDMHSIRMQLAQDNQNRQKMNTAGIQ